MVTHMADTTTTAGIEPRTDAFNKGIVRTIRGSLKRFLSILTITALGISVMIGLRAGCEDLRRSVDQHFDAQNIYDISVQSTLGLTEGDVTAVSELEGVDVAEGIYTETVFTKVGNNNKRVNVQSLSKSDIDSPILISGTLPEASDEIAVTEKYAKEAKRGIGDTLTFVTQDGTDTGAVSSSGGESDTATAGGGASTENSGSTSSTTIFKRQTYTITAIISDPTDILAESSANSFRESAAADFRFYVNESAAVSSAYTAIHLTVNGAGDLDCYSDDYTEAIDRVKHRIEGIRKHREKVRTESLTKDALSLIDSQENALEMELSIQQDNIDRLPAGAARDAAQAQLDSRRSEATKQLEDARTQAKDIGDATWYIQDRTNIASFASVDSDASSIESIATVFPVIFFVVAVLISLTTATRMVEEERILIGLYKALGYTQGRILSKYVGYALAACLAGGIIGNIIGFIALPLFLYTVFEQMKTLSHNVLSYDVVMSLGSVALFGIGIVGATVAACRHEMAETPASLMRPKAPRAGSRILLERIRPLWRRMGFLSKVTARNLFRYKKRFFMTVFGIAGCTALVICGMGIRDTVVSLCDKQYGNVARYDYLLAASEIDYDNAAAKLQSRSDARECGVRIDDSLAFLTDNVTFEYNGKKESVQLCVIPDESAENLAAYVSLTHEGGSEITLDTSAVVLSKSAQMVLGINAGDKATVQDSTLDTATFTVSDISLNYMGNTLYMTQSTYEKQFGKSMTANALYVNVEGSSASQIKLSRKLKDDGWVSISCTAAQRRDFQQNFGIVNSVVALISVLAAGLSFVVVFTLSNTNISERERELATIKVLGFRRHEVHHYVNKETLILTGIGAVIGMPLGYVLAESFTYVLQMPSLYFDVEVAPLSFLVAVALSFIFTIIVNLVTNRTLNRIDMVGALKSAE